jgi:FixJ family two-component response regulator
MLDIDIRMPEADGLELMANLAEADIRPYVILAFCDQR